jgi:hypothetical protein
VWQKRWLAHRNAASGLAAVVVCVADPAEAAQRYSRFTGLASNGAGNEWRIETVRGSVIFTDAGTLARALGIDAPALPWIAGYVLDAKDIARARSTIQASGFDSKDLGERIMVVLPPELGGVILFQRPQAGALRLG